MSDFLNPLKNLKALVRLAILALVVLVSLFLFFVLTGRKKEAAVLAAPVVKKVIPWTDRAQAQANSLLQGESGQHVADSVQAITHPTGRQPKLSAFDVRKVGEQLSTVIDVAWKGGITGQAYTTRVVWEFDKNNQIRAKVTDDSAPTSAGGAQKLDEYFRTEIYSLLRSNMRD